VKGDFFLAISLDFYCVPFIIFIIIGFIIGIIDIYQLIRVLTQAQL
jgi:hypothetical protein